MFTRCVLFIAVMLFLYAMVMTLLYFDAEKRVRHFASMWQKATSELARLKLHRGVLTDHADWTGQPAGGRREPQG